MENPALTIIECTRKRPKGTQVELDGKKYDFQPDDEGNHVAIVTNESHVAKFLNVPESFRLFAGVAPEPEQDTTATAVEIGAVVQQVTQQSAAPTVEPQGDDDADGPTAEAMEGMSIEELRSLFQEETGSKPHPAAKKDTLIAKIIEARAETGQE